MEGCICALETYVHDWDASLVKLFDEPFRGNSNSTNEEGSLLFNNDINKVGELSLCVIILFK